MIFSRLGVYAAVGDVIWISIRRIEIIVFLFVFGIWSAPSSSSLLSSIVCAHFVEVRSVGCQRMNSAASLLNAITNYDTVGADEAWYRFAVADVFVHVLHSVDFICLLINLTNPRRDDQIKWIMRVHDVMMNARISKRAATVIGLGASRQVYVSPH